MNISVPEMSRFQDWKPLRNQNLIIFSEIDASDSSSDSRTKWQSSKPGFYAVVSALSSKRSTDNKNLMGTRAELNLSLRTGLIFDKRLVLPYP